MSRPGTATIVLQPPAAAQRKLPVTHGRGDMDWQMAIVVAF